MDWENIFDLEKHAWPITKNADIISQGVSLRGIFGSKAMDDMFDCIVNCIKKWERSDLNAQHQKTIAQLTSARSITAKKKWEKKKTDKLKIDASAAELEGLPPSRPKTTPSHPLMDTYIDSEMAEGDTFKTTPVQPVPNPSISNIDPWLSSGTHF